MASASEQEAAGNRSYQNEHMAQLFDEGISFSGFERNTLYLARGDGTYVDISGVSGVDSITDGRGLAFGDLDNDGDLDVVITPVQEVARLVYRNNVGQDNAFVRVTVKGTQSASDAFGTVLRLETELGTQTKIHAGGRGFLSFSDPRVLFGVGTGNAEPYRLTVHWPSGLEESYDVRAGDSVLVTENEGTGRIEEKPFELPDPETASERILRTLNLEQGAPFPTLAGVGAMGDSGRRTLLNIWTTWCVLCSVEMPELERAYRALQVAGIDLIGLSVDTAPEGVPGYLEAKGITYPNFVVAEDDFPKIFKGDALTVPLTVLLDEAGLVVEAYSGWSTDTRAKIVQAEALGHRRKPFGRIAIANSDAGASATTKSAIDQAWRAVRETLSP